MREKSSERNCVHKGCTNETGFIPDGGGGGEESKEEEGSVERNSDKLSSEAMVQGKANVTNMDVECTEVSMEEAQSLIPYAPINHQKQGGRGLEKNPISYKAKLIGMEEEILNKSFDDQMAEWLKEEEELAPVVSEE